jgi:hypothetical protein
MLEKYIELKIKIGLLNGLCLVAGPVSLYFGLKYSGFIQNPLFIISSTSMLYCFITIIGGFEVKSFPKLKES